MIKLFRNIRKNLLNEGKTSKYFKYAIGEIVLVVIGILIALYLNNLNEQLAIQAKTDIILEDVLNELEINIKKIDDEIAYYHRKDTVYWVTQFNNVTKETFLNPKTRSTFWSMTTKSQAYELADDAYSLLIANSADLPLKYKPILADLKFLNTTVKKNLERFENEVFLSAKYNITYKANNFPWFSDNTKAGYDGEFNYMLTDFRYRNQVTFTHNLVVDNHFAYAMRYRSKAIDCYMTIQKFLNKQDSENGFYISKERSKPFVGSYKLITEIRKDSFFEELKRHKQFKIFQVNNRIYFSANGDSTKQEVIPFSKHQIVVNPADFFTLYVKDNDTILQTNSEVNYIKIAPEND